MDTTLILIAVFISLILGFLALFLITNFRKDNFVATDGSSFKAQSDLDLYQDLLLKTKPLFAFDEFTSSTKTILGYDRTFLTNLKAGGFKDLKTLLKYRNEFKALSALINS